MAEESFYVSGGFWATVAGVLVAVIAAWVSWRAGNRRRRLLYAMPRVTSLLRQDVPQGVEVRRGGKRLTDPHVVEVALFNQGRLDIPTSAFDQERPLVLEIGVPILEVLKVTTTSQHSLPVYVVDGTALRVGPDLIARRQKVTFSLLVDGRAPILSCRAPHPIDIDVREGEPVGAQNALLRTALAAVSVVAAGAITASLIATHTDPPKSSFNPQVPGPVRAQAQAVATILQAGSKSLKQVNDQLSVSFGSCSDLVAAIPAFIKIINSRKDAWKKSEMLHFDKLSNGVDLRQAMIDAYRLSAQSDVAFLAWAREAAKQRKCGDQPAEQTQDFREAIRVDTQAGAAKKRLTEVWNPMAQLYGLRTYNWREL